MESRTQVVLYGNTLIMASIAASLQSEVGLEVICVDPRTGDLRQNLRDLEPQTIIFDRTIPHPELDLALLREQPGLLLVGVDPSSDEVLVLTGQRRCVVSANELANLVSALDDHADAPIVETESKKRKTRSSRKKTNDET